jgi:hypothetical protein
MNKHSMLRFCKEIVEKVSFHDVLFEKEVKKAFLKLSPDELREFRAWLRVKFRDKSKFEYLFWDDPLIPLRYAR